MARFKVDHCVLLSRSLRALKLLISPGVVKVSDCRGTCNPSFVVNHHMHGFQMIKSPSYNIRYL